METVDRPLSDLGLSTCLGQPVTDESSCNTRWKLADDSGLKAS